MNIIGLSGFARAGKDTVADILVEEHGYIKVAFADKLRDFLYASDPIVVADYEHHGMMPTTYYGPVYRRLQSVIDEYGWSGYKDGPFRDDIRRLIQRVGTEAGREVLWDTVWIDAALSRFSETDNVVVPDVRFFNEFNAVLDRGGVVYRVERDGVGPVTQHPSELEALRFDYTSHIDNCGTVNDLRETIRNLVANVL